MSANDQAVTFSTRAPERRAGRYQLASTVDTGDGGRVGVGVDKRGDSALVYEIGHTQQGIPTHAAATAIASGKVVPVTALIGAFRETGQLDKLVKEIEKAQAPA